MVMLLGVMGVDVDGCWYGFCPVNSLEKNPCFLTVEDGPLVSPCSN